MSARITATRRALEAVGWLLEQPGRLALIRAEVKALGIADGACDRALRRLRDEGRIRRYGSGIYGVGGAKVFQAAPQALAALGYRVDSPEPPESWSARPNGTVIRVDRRCRRRTLGHGVQMKLETPDGRRATPRKVSMTATDTFRTQRETEAVSEAWVPSRRLDAASGSSGSRSAADQRKAAITAWKSRRNRSLSSKWMLIQNWRAPASAAASIFATHSSAVPAIAKRSAR